MADVNDDFSRICELEHALVMAQTSLLVIAQSLDTLADRYARAEDRAQGMTENDVNMLYGAANLVEQVAQSCYLAFKGGEARQDGLASD